MIRAYKINRFFECRFTHNVVAEVEFQMNEKFHASVHTLSSVETAEAYLDKEARDWFLPCLEKYIAHKKHIIEGKHPEQESALKVCINAYEHYQNFPTNKICAKFLQGIKHFQFILPNMMNSSHQSSANDLEQLRIFCEEFLKFKPYHEANSNNI